MQLKLRDHSEMLPGLLSVVSPVFQIEDFPTLDPPLRSLLDGVHLVPDLGSIISSPHVSISSPFAAYGLSFGTSS
jgi:hypothetical protein